MRHLVEKRGLTSEIKVDSAGTSNYHIGEPPHKGTKAKLQENSISTSGMKARQLRSTDLQEYDYLVCMDASNVSDTLEMLRAEGNAKVFRFLDLTPHKKDMPDPWYTGDFQETYDLCVDGCEALLTKIEQDL